MFAYYYVCVSMYMCVCVCRLSGYVLQNMTLILNLTFDHIASGRCHAGSSEGSLLRNTSLPTLSKKLFNTFGVHCMVRSHYLCLMDNMSK